MKKILVLCIASAILVSVLIFSATGSEGSCDLPPTQSPSPHSIPSSEKPSLSHVNKAAIYEKLTLDEKNKTEHAADQDELSSKFEWFIHDFSYEGKPAKLRYRLLIPEVTEGEVYPLVMTLHGSGSMGNDNTSHMNTLLSTAWAGEAFQKQYACYVLAVQMPFEGEVSYESEMAYLYEYGEIIKAVACEFGNIDINRIYTTGLSQGAGFSYGVIAAQPDLYAAALILAGTAVHSTWGHQIDIVKLKDVNLYIVHGSRDGWILPNEAYMVYETLKSFGKKNMTFELTTTAGLVERGLENLINPSGNGNLSAGASGHLLAGLCLSYEGTDWMRWLVSQKKGVPSTDAPKLIEWTNAKEETRYPGWNMGLTYPHLPLAGTNSESGSVELGRIRIGDPTATTYDKPDLVLQPGDILCMTIQGYTGAYGDDFAAFQKEWVFSYSIKSGSVASIDVTNKAIPGLTRGASVKFGGGAGPTKEGSMESDNVLNGQQVYVRIALADDIKDDELLLHFAFINPNGYIYYKEVKVPVTQ